MRIYALSIKFNGSISKKKLNVNVNMNLYYQSRIGELVWKMDIKLKVGRIIKHKQFK